MNNSNIIKKYIEVNDSLAVSVVISSGYLHFYNLTAMLNDLNIIVIVFYIILFVESSFIKRD